METRHFLVSGSPGVGKTSLLLTLARGIFPPDDASIPRRFEGWSIPVHGNSETAVEARAAAATAANAHAGGGIAGTAGMNYQCQQRVPLVVQRCHSLGSAVRVAVIVCMCSLARSIALGLRGSRNLQSLLHAACSNNTHLFDV